MENQKLRLALTIIFCVLILGAVYLSMDCAVAAVKANEAKGALLHLITFVSLALAFLYTIRGFTKDAAIFYKLFMFVYVVALFIKTIISGSVFAIAMSALPFAAVSVLTIAKDLGIKRSFALGCLPVTCALAQIIYAIVKIATTSEHAGYVSDLKNYISFFVIAALMFMMILAKYIDKKSRGTK